MKITIRRDEILPPLQAIQGIVESRNTMPVLSHFLLDASGDGGKIHATDLDIGLSQPIPITVDEPGAVCVPAKKFLEIIKEINAEEINLDVDAENRIKLQSGRTRFRIIGLPSSEFPDIPTMDRNVRVELDASLFSDMIARTVYATGESDTRYTLNGILIHSSSDTPNLRIVGTDGHRLATVTTDLETVPEGDWKVIITKKAAQEIRKLCESAADTVTVYLSTNHLLVAAGAVELISRLVDGTYPNYQQVIPSGNDKHLTVNREEFLSAVRRVALLGRERTFPVKVETGDDVVTVSSVNPEVGEASEEIAGTMDGEALTLGFNARYLQDALGHMGSESVIIDMADPLSPTLLRPADDTSYSCVIMPMRI